jgi:hypothetical protein
MTKEIIIDEITKVRTQVQNSDYVKKNLSVKSFCKNGVYISNAIETSKLEDAKSNIAGSLLWNDKKIIEHIHSYRFQVRQQVITKLTTINKY